MQCFILIFIFSSNFAFADILDLSPFHQISHAAQGLKRLASSIPILSNIERYRRIHELQKEMAENRAHVSKDQKDPGSELLAILNDDVPENAKEIYKPDDKQHGFSAVLNTLAKEHGRIPSKSEKKSPHKQQTTLEIPPRIATPCPDDSSNSTYCTFNHATREWSDSDNPPDEEPANRIVWTDGKKNLEIIIPDELSRSSKIPLFSLIPNIEIGPEGLGGTAISLEQIKNYLQFLLEARNNFKGIPLTDILAYLQLSFFFQTTDLDERLLDNLLLHYGNQLLHCFHSFHGFQREKAEVLMKKIIFNDPQYPQTCLSPSILSLTEDEDEDRPIPISKLMPSTDHHQLPIVQIIVYNSTKSGLLMTSAEPYGKTRIPDIDMNYSVQWDLVVGHELRCYLWTNGNLHLELVEGSVHDPDLNCTFDISKGPLLVEILDGRFLVVAEPHKQSPCVMGLYGEYRLPSFHPCNKSPAANITSLTVSNDTIICGNFDGTLSFWRISGKVITEPKHLDPKKHLQYQFGGQLENQPISSVATNLPQNDYALTLVAGSNKSSYIQVVRMNTTQKTFVFISEIEAHEGHINDIRFDPKQENLFATASTDGTIRLYRLLCDTGAEPVLEMRRHTGPVTSPLFLPANGTSCLISGGEDGNMITWNITGF